MSADPTVQVPVDWFAVENAWQTWFSSTTGLVTVWANQDAPRPAFPYATLDIPIIVKTGGPGERRFTTDLGAASGEEITVTTVSNLQATLSCQIHVLPIQSDIANCHARALMTAALGSLNTLAQQAVFNAIQVAVAGLGEILDISEPFEDTMINRTQLDVTFTVGMCVTETTGYINQVELEGTIDDCSGVPIVETDTVTGP